MAAKLIKPLLAIMFLGFMGMIGYAALERFRGDPKIGETLAHNICGECHDLSPARTIIYGPPMWGVVGRQAGTVKNFTYSSAFQELMAQHPIFWTTDNLTALIATPKDILPETLMDQMDHARFFQGVQISNRRDLISFLKTLHDAPPSPTAPTDSSTSDRTMRDGSN
jgi:cytochrome c